MAETMEAIVADFARLNPREGFSGEAIPLGSEHSRPGLLQYHDGQHVLLVEPGNLRAEGEIAIRVVNGIRYFYGVVTGPVQEDTQA
jgi:hypothetical protein